MNSCAGVQLYSCTVVPLVLQLCSCTISCTVVQLVVQLYRCTVGCTAVQSVVQLYSSLCRCTVRCTGALSGVQVQTCVRATLTCSVLGIGLPENQLGLEDSGVHSVYSCTDSCTVQLVVSLYSSADMQRTWQRLSRDPSGAGGFLCTFSLQVYP